MTSPRLPPRSPATSAQDDGLVSESSEGERPPLPPRPSNLTPQTPKTPNRPPLRSHATTALSLTEIQGQSLSEGARGVQQHSNASTPPRLSVGYGSPLPHSHRSRAGSDGDASSVRSLAPSHLPSTDVGALLEEALGSEEHTTWAKVKEAAGKEVVAPLSLEEPTDDFGEEFEDIGELDAESSNVEALLRRWRSKKKHFHILSAAGKPIYNRHGTDNLISGEIGVIQTILSFYEDVKDQLRSFSAGKTIFVVITRGPLHLLAISRLGESESQLRNQLEAMYMQILSTLTLPRLTSMFSNRPSTDLRRPLQGTDSLLSALADSFTRGSPSTLLSALECLKLKNSQRQAINNTLLKTKCKELLYGLIVAGGKLVSVVRPRTHSLHPGDLQLIFNMLFEAEGVKAGGGDSWIPMCLPGFNKNGYLYMYVSFLDLYDQDLAHDQAHETDGGTNASDRAEDRIAILLISADKESFYELQGMKDDVVAEMERTGLLGAVRRATRAGRPEVAEVASGTPLQHFLYKSRGNLQYVMAAMAAPRFGSVLQRRRLLSLYARLHADVHAARSGGGGPLRVHQVVSTDAMALAWLTPLFELYCVADPATTRNALAQGANKVVQWVRREEERVFIIGGAVF